MIPGNQSTLAELSELMHRGTVVGFVGAGASSTLWPLWPTLLRRLAEVGIAIGRATAEDAAAWAHADDPEIVAQMIRESLGMDEYAAALRAIFSRPQPRAGRTWTVVQETVVQRLLCGLVTTNYDPGLLDARVRLRPDVVATGYTNSADSDALARWITGDVFAEEGLPILHLHGAVDRPSSIILAQDEYRRLYGRDIVQQTIRTLWQNKHLLFIGYGLRDPRLNALADIVQSTLAGTGVGNRHYAFVPLPRGLLYSPELRRAYEARGGIRPIFYYLDEDTADPHAELAPFLQELPASLVMSGRLGPGFARPTFVSNAFAVDSQRPPVLYAHDGTDDNFFVDRPLDAERLTRWIADPEVRAIAVTGLGGIGKTALVSAWLKGIDHRQHFDGAMFWSFYSDPNPEAFFERLVALGSEHLAFRPNSAHKSVEQAGVLVKRSNLLIILDGLEVIQEVEASARFGSITHQSLRQFMTSILSSHRSVAVFTSRFPLADLDRELGRRARWLPLVRLTLDQGVRLLENLGVESGQADLARAVEELEGHALALRILANAARSTGSLTAALSQLGAGGSSLETKLVRLVHFYFSVILPDERAAIQALALFRSPVDEATARTLWTSQQREPASAAQVLNALDSLVESGLCTRETSPYGSGGYACHPVLRDTCRLTLLSRETQLVAAAVDLLTGKPGIRGQSADEFSAICDAVVLLLQVGNPLKALGIVQTRLGGGEEFLSRPGLSEGNEILAHLATGRTWKAALGTKSLARLEDLGRLLSYSAEAARLSGDVRLAMDVGARAFPDLQDRVDELGGDLPDDVWDRLTLTEFRNFVDQGLLREAFQRIPHPGRTIGARAWRGHLRSLQGHMEHAERDFDSVRLGHDADLNSEGLGDLAGFEAIWWTDHLVCTHRANMALPVARRNEVACRREPNFPTWSSSLRALGLCLLRVGESEEASEHLLRAVVVADTTSQLIHYLEAQLACAFVDLRSQCIMDGLQRVEEVLSTAISRGWRLVQIDGLDLRALLNDEGSPISAEDDRMQADGLARRFGYVRRPYLVGTEYAVWDGAQ